MFTLAGWRASNRAWQLVGRKATAATSPASLPSSARGLNVLSASSKQEADQGDSNNKNSDTKAFWPKQGVEEVLVRQGVPGPLTVASPGDAAFPKNRLFLYSTLTKDFEKVAGGAEEEGWLYGVQVAEGEGWQRAVPTGRPGDILKGTLFTFPSPVFAEKLKIADTLHGFDSQHPHQGSMRRDLVSVVRQDGSAQMAQWYYQSALPVDLSRPILAFDFDGVICDSVDESTISAYRHARLLWPDLFSDPKGYLPLLPPMRRVRPIVEFGYENTILIRLLSQEGLSPDDILQGWPGQLREKYLAKYQIQDKKQLIEGFGKVRDAWIEEDFQAWLAPNKPYPGVSEFIRSYPPGNLFIITTKQKRFTLAILESWAVPVPMEHVYALEDGPKPEVLKSLVARYPSASISFIEDKIETLAAVAKTPGLSKIDLVLVTWGYNTVEVHEKAKHAGHRVISSIQDLLISK
eukprot:gb/GEZN01007015.1/.p1 GENE.gb/GEZN01007015.1/~~gb/GEZN01007015.1/.p1  ORF type:complete len:503 (+),score=57.59 gb/GEZN01007015.1/:124-1509(+)